MTKTLINIDYTYDFVALDGSLTCGQPGIDIQHTITNITKTHYDAQDYIVFAIDGHYEHDIHHPETALFPPHNIVGTTGRELFGELKSYYDTIKDAPNVKTMLKTRYSAFAGTDLDIRLRERGIRTVCLVGVCSDICVLHTAIDAYNLGYQIEIYANAIASFNQQGHDWALTHFTNTLGARVI